MKDIKPNRVKIKYYLIMNLLKAFILFFIPFIVFLSFYRLLKNELLWFLISTTLGLLIINLIFVFISFYSFFQEKQYEISILPKELVLKNTKTNIKYNIPYDEVDKYILYYIKRKTKMIKIKIKRTEYDIRLFDDDKISEIAMNIRAVKRHE